MGRENNPGGCVIMYGRVQRPFVKRYKGRIIFFTDNLARVHAIIIPACVDV